jgi:Rrf2 family protein
LHPGPFFDENACVRISAKVDYAARAMVELTTVDGPISTEALARRQDLPVKFLQGIMMELRRAGLIQAQRGRDGGYHLARPASEISLADVIRAVEGPLAEIHGLPPEHLSYHGTAEPLAEVWIALRANVRAVLEHVTLAQLAEGRLPHRVATLAAADDARLRR